MLHRFFLHTLLIVIYINFKANAFNLSPVPNLILKEPLLQTPQKPVRSAYFGYSVVLRENSILVAAPRAQSTLSSQGAINETGAIYKCPLSKGSNMASPPNCYPFVFDDSPNIIGENSLNSAIKDYQWLGAAMDGGSQETDNIIVCAPKFAAGFDIVNDKSYLHGVCYWSMNTLSDKPRMVKNSVINPLNHSGMQTKKRLSNKYPKGKSIYNYQLGEAGFSVHITPNNLEFLIGAPGIEEWKGSVIHYNKQTGQSTVLKIPGDSFSYAGYAVGSGYLDSGNREKILYVVAMPNANATEKLGEVCIFDIGDKGTIDKYAHFQGEHYGEYFGYAVLVEDINGDGLDEVLVTAPQYTVDAQVDVGILHVFHNKGNFIFGRQLITSPFGSNGRFGTTITKLGDINLDGYKDIAVGAPFANGIGNVVIYLGGPNGLRESQILSADSLATDSEPVDSWNVMFGHGISKGVDFDRNGYNDIAIGAPNIGRVFIYRAYPVVKIVASIRSLKSAIDMSEQELELEVCYHIVTNSSIVKEQGLIMSIEVDKKIRRVTLVQSESHLFKFTAVAGLENKCQTFLADVTFLPRHIFVPIAMELTYQLRFDGSVLATEEFCMNCTVVDPKCPKSVRNVVNYQHGCKNKVCDVDLKIPYYKMPEVVLLGNFSVMSTKFFIENSGEKAFDTQVTITTSLNLPYAKIPSYCVEIFDVKLKLVCALAQGQAFTGRTVLEIDFDVSSDLDFKHVTVKAIASSTGNELHPFDNAIEGVIEFAKYSTIEVNGLPIVAEFNLDNTKGVTAVSYILDIHNFGPSCLSHPEFRITVPVAYNNFQGKHFQFVDISTMNLSIFLNDDNFPTLKFNLIENSGFPLSLETMQFRSLYFENYKSSKNIPDNRLALLNCTHADFVICAESQLKLPLLEHGRNLSILLKYEIDRKSVADFMGDSVHYLGIMPDVFLQTITKMRSDLNITKSLEPTRFVKTLYKTPLWIYILAIIGGILLLLILILTLIKLGFFKRQTKEDMEKLLSEKEEVARMKLEINKMIDDVDNIGEDGIYTNIEE